MPKFLQTYNLSTALPTTLYMGWHLVWFKHCSKSATTKQTYTFTV